MDSEERQRLLERARRRDARRRVYRRRRLVALAVLALLVGVAVSIVAGAGGSGDDGRARAGEPPELPRGGRRVLPGTRVVALYGAPQAQELGALGIGSPASAARRLARQARPYSRPGRPVLPAFELIATIAQAAPGSDGDFAARQPPATIARYLRAARRSRSLLVLDIQPGRSAFTSEVRALERFLREPEVSIALDPEWSMDAGEVPGQVIGSTDAATVNAVSRYLSRLVRRHDLPQKLLVVHRFTTDMIEDESSLERHPGVALVLNVDGFGDRPNKVSKYREFTRGRRGRFNGFKLFYGEDVNLMTPRQVLALRPAPDLVVYE